MKNTVRTAQKNIHFSPNKFSKFIGEFEQSLKVSNHNSSIFYIYGMGGVGKSHLLKQIERKHKENNFFISIDLGQINAPKNPLDLMRAIDDGLFRCTRLEDKREKWLELSPFYKNYNLYIKTIGQLSSQSVQDNEPISKEQINQVKNLIEKGANTLGLLLPIPGMTSSLLGEVAKSSVDLATVLLSIKDDLLNKHKATKESEDLQNLVLTPLVQLTPKLIESLHLMTSKGNLILLLEEHENFGSTNEEKNDFNQWLSWFFNDILSSFKDGRYNDKEDKYKIRIVVSGKRRFSNISGWKKLERNEDFNLVKLERFSEEETRAYLTQKLGLESFLKEEIRNIYQETKGHIEYLEWVCKQKEEGIRPDYSNGSRKVANKLLQDFTPKQREAVQVLACSRWFDKRLIQDLLKAQFSPAEDDPIFWNEIFNRLITESFVELSKDKYEFDALARQVLRRLLFQNDREKFHECHQHLANYFKSKADKISCLYTPFARYQDDEWCEYMGEFLYHSCFAQDSSYQKSFLYHVFAAIYLRQSKIIDNSFGKIIQEFDLPRNPLLHNSSQKFLDSLSFLVDYNWVAFELSYKTAYGKYKLKILRLLRLCENLVGSLDKGIGKFAVLEYIARNCSLNDQRRRREELLEQAKESASCEESELSSQLFLQSSCQQNISETVDLEYLEHASKCYEAALDCRPEDANIWYKTGEVHRMKGKYSDAVRNYKKALEIQPYDHRYLCSLGDTLRMQATEILKSEEFRSNERSVNYEQVMLYYKALMSYREAKAFRPDLKDIQDKFDKTKTSLSDILSLLGKTLDPGDYEANSLENDDYRSIDKEGDSLRQSNEVTSIKVSLEKYNKVIRKKPDYPLGWFHRGLAFTELGNFADQEGGNLGREGNEVASRQSFEIALAYYERAIKDYNKALELQPDLDWAYYDRGRTFRFLAFNQKGLKEFDKVKIYQKTSLDDFDKALQIDLDYKEAWYHRGLILRELNRIEEAIASYDKVIELVQASEPKVPDILECSAWYDRGVAFLEARLLEEALASFEHSVSICKRALDAIKNKDNVTIEKDSKEFVHKLEQSYRSSGYALFELGNYQEAISNFNASIKLDPKGFENILGKVKCLNKINQNVTAYRILQLLKQKNPTIYQSRLKTDKKTSQLVRSIVLEVKKTSSESNVSSAVKVVPSR